MNDSKKRHEITLKKVVYEIPGMHQVNLQREVRYGANEALTMDLYRPSAPASPAGDLNPAVLFVAGFPDPGFEAFAGCKLKELASYISWGKLVAASGMIGIAYSNVDPIADLDALLAYLGENAASLGIDRNRIAVWACSGNVPRALPLIMQGAPTRFSAALFSYGVMLDAPGSTALAEAATRMGFAHPAAGRSVDEVLPDLPLMIVRAGREEMPGLNDSIDRFVAAALTRNLPLTVVNHTTGPHSFDILDDSETSREIVRRMLAFLRFHLSV